LIAQRKRFTAIGFATHIQLASSSLMHTASPTVNNGRRVEGMW